MNEQAHDNQDQPFEEVQPIPGDQAPDETGIIYDEQAVEAEPQGRKFRLSWQLAAGFLGWFLVNGLLWLLLSGGFKFNPNEEGLITLNGLCVFPLNLAILVWFLWNKRTRPFGQGILIALGVNFAISLILGLGTNAACLVPFFS